MGGTPSRPSEELAATLQEGIETACATAARLIQQADVLLLCTGAGFSADSGLAIYADVAKVAAYKSRELEYHDICHPKWLFSEPELFWGFWGQCYNDYRDTAPHPGYEIIDRWADKWFRHSQTAEDVRTILAGRKGQSDDVKPPYIVADHAGAFFVFTSNVDAHHFDWFRACEIRECHGNTELYQCAGNPENDDRPCPAVWRAPLDFRFQVDKTTMLAPKARSAKGAEAPTAAASDTATAAGEADAPRVGRIRGSARTTTLRYMPSSPDGLPSTADATGFAQNHPTCPGCGGLARPAILMFGDGSWLDDDSQAERWSDWAEGARTLAERRNSGPTPLRVVLLEIGAGNNVTTVRSTAERELKKFLNSGADAKLVRINPDFPLGDGEDFSPTGCNAARVVSVMGRGLPCLQLIDAAMGQSGAK